jgi:HPt (histidine-containing phosphotransfer) domain-containing protein
MKPSQNRSHAAESAPLSAFDAEDLMDRLMGDEVLGRTVVALFLEEMPREIAGLARAVSSSDHMAIQFAAHSIKSASANVGAKELAAAAFRLEQLGQIGDCAEEALHEIATDFENARIAMQEYCRVPRSNE